jgi:endonuclease/exonuclease/phosphatase family metal-dependent hydrolase
MRAKSIIPVLALALLAGCSTAAYNYVLPQGPRYAGAVVRANGLLYDDTLDIVSFNIAWARGIDSALVVLQTDAGARSADVILLQEMDAPSTARMAAALGMHYVYYPATLHPKTKRDFGNAILSRWPIVADAKILLPHISRLRRTRRAATAATIRIGATDVRVYSAHLGTVAEIGFGERRNQLRAILADAAQHDRVVLGGDMNEPWLGGVAGKSGFAWPTKEGPRTAIVGRVDHIFIRGLHATATGTVVDNRGASDHRPVWVRATLSVSP